MNGHVLFSPAPLFCICLGVRSIAHAWVFCFFVGSTGGNFNNRSCHALGPPAKLFKKNSNDILFTLKAWNGRCVLEWLADRLRSAASIPDYVAACDQLQMNSVALILSMYYFGGQWDMIWSIYFVFHSVAKSPICPQFRNMPQKHVDRKILPCWIWGVFFPHCTFLGAPAQDSHGTSSWPNGKGSAAHVARLSGIQSLNYCQLSEELQRALASNLRSAAQALGIWKDGKMFLDLYKALWKMNLRLESVCV